MPVRKTVEHLTLGDIPIPDPIARNGPDSPDGQNEQDGLDPQERPSGYGFEGEVTVTWEKVLWRKQPFPDNYVPPTFLAELNALRQSYSQPNLGVFLSMPRRRRSG